MITRDNYEIWFLDYLEERLQPEQEEMVRQFAATHPDLAEELDLFAPALTADSLLVYPGKEKLKKEALHDTSFLENQVVAAMENDLAEGDRLQLEDWLAVHPDQYKMAQMLYKCRLHPDQDTRFPHKERLKKKSIFISFSARITAIAAILLLALVIFFPDEKRDEPINLTTTDLSVKQPGKESAGSTSIPNTGEVAMVVKSLPDEKRISESSHKKRTTRSNSKIVPILERQEMALLPMNPKMVEITPELPSNIELAPVKEADQSLLANLEMPISDYLKSRALELKASDDHELFSRNKVVIAGLNFVSRLTGKNLTGKKGGDGRLRTISFNTQLLAFSIPVNRQL